jgi:hydrogenase maturation protease
VHFLRDALSQVDCYSGTVVIIGLGNEFRHDDAVGLFAARRLHGVEHQADVGDLIASWEGLESVILIDAVSSGAAPGTIHRLDVTDSPVPRELFKNSTHALGLADAIELSRALGTLPHEVLIYGIEVRDTTAGIGLSPEVATALEALIASLR